MKRSDLEQAVAEHVQPGMHLHFASTPSRSNAAIRAVARRFRDRSPGFVLSTTGFHSTAHLLGMLRLGRRYVACFFGDNYPRPRPNALYQELIDEGADLQHWSLWTYVSALRAAAFGQPFALTRSLAGTTLGERLAASGNYFEVTPPSGAGDAEPFGLLRPLVPDITFLHAPLGDERGYAWFSPPHCEGFHAAFAARLGVIITVDAFAESSRIETHPELIPIPPHRVLSICEAPFGAHPQPVHFAPESPAALSYDDDFEHYRLWRELTRSSDLQRRFLDEVLPGGDAAYRAFVGNARLGSLRDTSRPGPRARSLPPSARAARVPPVPPALSALEPNERQTVLAARAITGRIRQRRLCTILAGIGSSFSAARLAHRLLLEEGIAVELLVETGLAGFGETPDRRTDSFLLSRTNMLDSRRLTDVDNVLGSTVCGGSNACLGVIGSAEVDAQGNVNSTLVGGMHLVGSGGACDVALAAHQVVVLARSNRLVERVSHVTSPGKNVGLVITEHAVLERDSSGAWRASTVVDGDGAPLPACWNVNLPDSAEPAASLSRLEWHFMATLREEASLGKRTKPLEKVG